MVNDGVGEDLLEITMVGIDDNGRCWEDTFEGGVRGDGQPMVSEGIG